MGFWQLRDSNATETGCQLQFVKLVAFTEFLATLVITVLMLPQTGFAEKLCDVSCIWHVPSV